MRVKLFIELGAPTSVSKRHNNVALRMGTQNQVQECGLITQMPMKMPPSHSRMPKLVPNSRSRLEFPVSVDPRRQH